MPFFNNKILNMFRAAPSEKTSRNLPLEKKNATIPQPHSHHPWSTPLPQKLSLTSTPTSSNLPKNHLDPPGAGAQKSSSGSLPSWARSPGPSWPPSTPWNRSHLLQAGLMRSHHHVPYENSNFWRNPSGTDNNEKLRAARCPPNGLSPLKNSYILMPHRPWPPRWCTAFPNICFRPEPSVSKRSNASLISWFWGKGARGWRKPAIVYAKYPKKINPQNPSKSTSATEGIPEKDRKGATLLPPGCWTY